MCQEVAFADSKDPMRDDPELRETPCQKHYFSAVPTRREGFDGFDGNVRITFAKRTSTMGGAAVYTIGHIATEGEVLFPPGSRFKVRSAEVKEVDGEKRFFVTYEQLSSNREMNWAACPPTMK